MLLAVSAAVALFAVGLLVGDRGPNGIFGDAMAVVAAAVPIALFAIGMSKKRERAPGSIVIHLCRADGAAATDVGIREGRCSYLPDEAGTVLLPSALIGGTVQVVDQSTWRVVQRTVVTEDGQTVVVPGKGDKTPD